MKSYLLLFRNDQTDVDELSLPERNALLGQFVSWTEDLQRRKRLHTLAQLQPPMDGVTVRRRHGALTVDGPYAEGKEAVVGLLYRDHAARMIAALTRALGPANLDLVESAVQDAFMRALRTWPERGTPDNPPAWLFTVARNHALDVVRRDARFSNKRAAIADALPTVQRDPAGGAFAWELPDDQLRMMLVTCHPILPMESRLALTLHALCGLRPADIAAALLAKKPALEKRLVRARKTLRDADIDFDLPGPAVLGERIEDILRVLYLLFSEGYSRHSGDHTINAALCAEAMRLCSLLAGHPPTDQPAVHALLALMALHASRLHARVGADNELITLAEQDRSLWDRSLIARGLRALATAADGEQLTEYHLEAGIAACHAVATDFAATDWTRIVHYYDQLTAINPSPVIQVNRAGRTTTQLYRHPTATAAHGTVPIE